MGHSYTSNFIHCVFSTRERSAIIPADLEEQLWAYFVGVARNHDIELLAAGGTQNHVHVLIALPSAMPLSEAINKLKSNSFAVDRRTWNRVRLARGLWRVQRQRFTIAGC